MCRCTTASPSPSRTATSTRRAARSATRPRPPATVEVDRGRQPRPRRGHDGEPAAGTADRPARCVRADGRRDSLIGAITPIDPPATPTTGADPRQRLPLLRDRPVWDRAPDQALRRLRLARRCARPRAAPPAAVMRFVGGAWVPVLDAATAGAVALYQTNPAATGDLRGRRDRRVGGRRLRPRPAPRRSAGSRSSSSRSSRCSTCARGRPRCLRRDSRAPARPAAGQARAIEAEGLEAAALREVRTMTRRRSIAHRLGALLACSRARARRPLACGTGKPPIRIGAVFPISGNAAASPCPELPGVQIAADLVNADGGIAGRRIELEVRDLRSRDEADGVMADLRGAGDPRSSSAPTRPTSRSRRARRPTAPGSCTGRRAPSPIA